jgi:hypothetical protein
MSAKFSTGCPVWAVLAVWWLASSFLSISANLGKIIRHNFGRGKTKEAKGGVGVGVKLNFYL